MDHVTLILIVFGIWNSLISGVMIFLITDYFKFRFDPPYMTKEHCLQTHNYMKDIMARIEKKIDELKGGTE